VRDTLDDVDADGDMRGERVKLADGDTVRDTGGEPLDDALAGAERVTESGPLRVAEGGGERLAESSVENVSDASGETVPFVDALVLPLIDALVHALSAGETVCVPVPGTVSVCESSAVGVFVVVVDADTVGDDEVVGDADAVLVLLDEPVTVYVSAADGVSRDELLGESLGRGDDDTDGDASRDAEPDRSLDCEMLSVARALPLSTPLGLRDCKGDPVPLPAAVTLAEAGALCVTERSLVADADLRALPEKDTLLVALLLRAAESESESDAVIDDV